MVVAFNPSSISRVCVRATNWLGDAVMSLPAIRAVRQVFPHAHVAVVAVATKATGDVTVLPGVGLETVTAVCVGAEPTFMFTVV